jgi:hypothetical protein
LALSANAVVNTKDPVAIGKVMALIGLKAQVQAYDTVFFIGAIIVFVGAFLALLMPDVEMKKGVTVHVE